MTEYNQADVLLSFIGSNRIPVEDTVIGTINIESDSQRTLTADCNQAIPVTESDIKPDSLCIK